MGHPANGAAAASIGGSESDEDVSVTGVGVPNVLLSTVRELERGDLLGARYQIEAVIGTGGSGRVLRAFDRESRTPVALKILRPEFAADPVWAERFSRELRIGRSITHPNVCRVYDIGDADGHKFLSMELATGGSIRAEVPKVGATRMTPTRRLRSWAERASDARAVVDGIAALHTAGIVHRDIKPENILRMEDGRLVVTDFGLATDPGANAGNTVMVGTPSYMAPEVVMGDPATMRSDVWGLGVVLHEILFGCRPQWKAAGRGYRKFVPPDECTTSAQRAAADLCGRCADDSAEMRPASAVEVQRELGRALQGKRSLLRGRGRQIGWAAVAVASFATLGLIRERWTTRAQASLSHAASPLAERVLTPTGTPEDWSMGATKVASFAGRLHCYSLVDGGTKVRAIWGVPRRAEDVDLKTGERTPSNLLPETYQDGCPALSPDGKSLLFEKAGETGTHIFLASSAGAAPIRSIVRGSAPQWLPNGQEFVMAADSHHSAVFSLPTGEMTFVTEAGSGKVMFAEQTIDSTGKLLAVRYTTTAPDSIVVVHSLPSLETIGRVRIPFSNGRLTFDRAERVLFLHESQGGEVLMAAADWRHSRVAEVGRIPGTDLKGLLARGDGSEYFVTSHLRRNLWIDSGRARTRLTEDDSVHGSMSASGAIVFQRTLADARRVIFLQAKGEAARQVTAGPTDVTPAFFPDGRAWLFAAINSSEIIRCELETGKCRPILKDPLVPGFPQVDHAGTQIAYVTLANAPRLKIASVPGNSEPRDLGPVGDTCSPVWTTDRNVWVVQSVIASTALWIEVDTVSGGRTGRRESITVDGSEECPVPAEVAHLRGDLFPAGLKTISEESAEISMRVHRGL